MSEPTQSVAIHEWSDPPEDGRDADEWPYPTRYQKSLVEGGLADAIRARLGRPASEPVFLTETVVSGGYSEYTQENDFYHTITVGDEVIEVQEGGWEDDGINALIRWLDGEPAA